MLTRWGRNIADLPLNDYPRPQMVRETWTNLNGWWSYAITPLTAPKPGTWQGQIRVPFCVEAPLSGVARSVSPEERLWYQRTFTCPNISRRQLLHFGAVDYECTLYINGGLVGSHTGGFDPFSFDITEYIQQGENVILLAVTDATSRSDQMRGKQHLNPQRIWYTPVTGIWQTVWLEELPMENHIEEVRIQPAPSCDAIDLIVHLHRPTRDPCLAAEIRISRNSESLSIHVVPLERSIRIDIAAPELWSPDHPALYDLAVSLIRIDNPLPAQNEDLQPAQIRRVVPLRGTQEAELYAAASADQQNPAEIIDRVASYFALRHIELAPHPEQNYPALLLNGAPLFQLGPLDQGWWPDGLHTPPSDDAICYELEFLKSAGFNTLRKHIKVEPARYYWHCDRLGILVWQDMPSGFLPAQFVAPNDDGDGLKNSRATEQFELEMQRIVNRLQHHPSIVMWVLHNEGWGQFDTQRLSERLRNLDPHRLVNATSGWLDVGCGDVIDRHDYAAVPVAPEPDGRRALVIGEYGGIGWPVKAHLWNPDMDNWGYQTLHDDDASRSAYAEVNAAIVHLAQTQGLCAAIYTQTSDVEGEVNGLLTYDREVEKFKRAWLQAQHAPLTRPEPH